MIVDHFVNKSLEVFFMFSLALLFYNKCTSIFTLPQTSDADLDLWIRIPMDTSPDPGDTVQCTVYGVNVHKQPMAKN